MKITEISEEKNLKSEMQQQSPIPKTTENMKDLMPVLLLSEFVLLIA